MALSTGIVSPCQQLAASSIAARRAVPMMVSTTALPGRPAVGHAPAGAPARSHARSRRPCVRAQVVIRSRMERSDDDVSAV
jgi:hypothetical protein